MILIPYRRGSSQLVHKPHGSWNSHKTTSMEKPSRSQDLVGSLASHGIPLILRNLKVRYCGHNDPQFVPVANKINLVHASQTISLGPILILNITIYDRVFQAAFLLQVSQVEPCIHFLSHPCYTLHLSHTHDFITLTTLIFGEKYKS
jgi:hypothetical protein